MDKREVHRSRKTGIQAVAIIVLAAVSPLALAAGAKAQDVGLRGLVDESAIPPGPLDSTSASKNPVLLTPGAASALAPQEPYKPVSQGAVPNSEIEDPLLQQDDPLQAAAAPIGSRQRTQEMEAAAAKPKAVAKKKASAVDDTTTATVREPSVTSDDLERNTRVLPESTRVGAIEGKSVAPDANPYAPLGIRMGNHVLLPSLETGIRATSNADSSPGGRSAVFSETTLRLKTRSDMATDSLSLDAYATLSKSVSGPRITDPEVGLDAALRFDLFSDHQLNATAGYSLKRETAESPEPIPAGASRPLLHNFNASLGVENMAGKLRYGLTGAVDRNIYGDAALNGGGSLSQTDRNYTLATAKLRLGYEVSPALIPFIEGEYGKRMYDNATDASGYRRSATRMALRGGAEIDLGEKLNGELSAGWLRETPDDKRLSAISGLSLLASLNWSPIRGTTAHFSAGANVESSTTAGSSGSLLHTLSVNLDRELAANLTGSALLSASLRDYAGSSAHDTIYAGQIGFTWWLNRSLGLTGRVRHERQSSTLAGRSYSSNSVFLGLKLQH